MGTQSTAPSTGKIKTVCNAVLDAVSTTDTVPWLNTLISCYVKIDNVSAGMSHFSRFYWRHEQTCPPKPITIARAVNVVLIFQFCYKT